MSRADDDRYREWKGAYAPYDLVKEFAVALGVVVLLAVALTVLFTSPDEKPSTIATWARSNPTDFLTTATGELAGTSELAGYGAPYNHTADAGQKLGPLKLQQWAGVHFPINTSRDFVLAPLRSIPANPPLRQALTSYQAAPPKQQTAWTDAYTKALEKARIHGAAAVLPPGKYGPVASMLGSLLGLAQAGGLDGQLVSSQQFYQTNYTKPLLFMADGSVLSDRAQKQHLLGDQWGMMNETGSYPGQVWLWLYTAWYQLKPFQNNDNADVQIMAIMAILSLAFISIPFLPGVRSIPRWIPLHRLIWREHYHRSTDA